jgi:DNA-binding response OmpR family regulator
VIAVSKANMKAQSGVKYQEKHARTEVQDAKKTIVICSPDLSFCFCLSTFLQDRYTVLTTTNSGLLENFAQHFSINLVLVDAEPSAKIIEQVQNLKKMVQGLPILMVYVYRPRAVDLDNAIRKHIDGVMYKPFDVHGMSERIEKLLVP